MTCNVSRDKPFCPLGTEGVARTASHPHVYILRLVLIVSYLFLHIIENTLNAIGMVGSNDASVGWVSLRDTERSVVQPKCLVPGFPTPKIEMIVEKVSKSVPVWMWSKSNRCHGHSLHCGNLLLAIATSNSCIQS